TAHIDPSPGLSRGSQLSFGERGGQAYDPDGVVEWAVACGAWATPVYRGSVLGGKLGRRLRNSACVFGLLRSLRIPALVHASAEAAEFGTVRNFLSAEWASSAPSPLHEQEFQCGVATGRCLFWDAAAALQSEVRTSGGALGARRATANGCLTGVNRENRDGLSDLTTTSSSW